MEYRIILNLLVYNKDRSNHLRGKMEVELPFAPSIGMHVKYKDMYPLLFKRVTWITDQDCFDCIVEEEFIPYEFCRGDDIEELIDRYDILRDAKDYNWVGFDNIYRDN
jgi:hypothetical protein